MINPKQHKIFLGLISILMLIIGLSFANFSTAILGKVDLQIVSVGLTLTNTILILIVGGLAFDIREKMMNKPRGKK